MIKPSIFHESGFSSIPPPRLITWSFFNHASGGKYSEMFRGLVGVGDEMLI